MSPEGMRLSFVGPGRLGLSLGYALAQSEAGVRLSYSGRHPQPPAHPLFVQGLARYTYGLRIPRSGTDAVFLSVPDDAVHDTALGLAGLGAAPSGCAAFHLSGATSTDVLAPLHERGYSVGALHPLQVVSNPVTGADLLAGSFFAVTGEPQARLVAQRVLGLLGSPWFEVPATRRPLYDAAAVLASTYLTVLLEQARDMLVRAGVPWEDATPALKRVVMGALTHLAGEGTRPASGPLSRGDLETIRLHLRTLEPAEKALYAALGAAALDVDGAGLDEGTRRQIRELFEEER